MGWKTPARGCFIFYKRTDFAPRDVIHIWKAVSEDSLFIRERGHGTKKKLSVKSIPLHIRYQRDSLANGETLIFYQ